MRKTTLDKKGNIKGDEPTGKVNNYTTYEVILDMFLFGISTGLRWSNLVTIKGINYDYDTEISSILEFLYYYESDNIYSRYKIVISIKFSIQ